MSRHDPDDDYDPTDPPSASFLRPTPPAPHHLPREARRSGRQRRHERHQSYPAQPIHGVPDPAEAARGAAELNPGLLSPPSRSGGPSPTTEIAILPGGGVEIPTGFKFNQADLNRADQGRYRTRNRDLQDGESPQPRVLGGLGFGVFKGLRKIPAAIVKAGRSYGPRSPPRQDVGPLPQVIVTHESPVQDHDDVETYMEQDEDEDPARSEQLLREEQLVREYTQRRRIRRDRAHGHRSRRVREPHYVPAPQPVLVPGARTPAASQVGHSQAGVSDVPPRSVEAHLEAEELEREREALAQAQARERARNVYASEAVKPPPSSSASISHARFLAADSPPSHSRTPSGPRLSNHVFSRWAAERDEAGRRKENSNNRHDMPSSAGPYSPLSLTNILRIIQQIRDLPWVGERVAADYVPGGVRPDPSSLGYPSSPRSGSSLMSSDRRGGDMSQIDARKSTGQSWYASRDDMIVLPAGVAPPPGFIPFPYPIHQAQRASAYGDAPSASSHTHVESDAPAPTSATGPMYVGDERHHYMPGAASATGQPYVFVPSQDGRHHPLAVPVSETGRRSNVRG